jgi:CHRD domain
MLRRLFACAALAAAASAQVTYFAAYLDGAQEVPPVASPGHGWGIVRLDAGSGTVQLYCYHTVLSATANAAHLHQGAVGVGGGAIVVTMAQIAPTTWTGSGALSPAQIAALQSDGMYLNVHTATNPGGEIRGQVVRATSTRFTAVLNGAQEVPPTPSGAIGTAVAFLHEPENRLVYVVDSFGLANVTAANIRQAASGVTGPIAVPLNGSGGAYCGVSNRLTGAQRTALLADGFYASIATAAFPGGEIRGQLRRDQGDHFWTFGTGAQVNPPVVTNGILGCCLIVGPNGSIGVAGKYSGLSGPATAAQVRVGAVGVNGPTVFPLLFAGGLLTGTFLPSTADLTNLRAGLWYVDLRTGANPGGEVRGQLQPAVLPTTYGEGCRTSTGSLPQAGATAFACMGGTVQFDLYGSVPNGFAVMVIGDSRDAPLPIELTLAGINAPGCVALTNVLLTYAAFPDARGCASQGIDIPLDPALRNIPLTNQWLIFDQPANPVGLVVSNGLTFFVQ